MQKSMDESKKTVAYKEKQMAGTEAHSKEKQGSSPFLERSSLQSPRKPKWQVFAFGFGIGKGPTKMELNDIKSRQLRQQTTTTISDGHDDESGRSEKKRWWRLIDVFSCGGEYEGDTTVKDLRASFRTLRKFD
ncbi:hypothetical protein L2E82_32379 [Cichorium intybus]|uniref:Uncharacterized protein n=1 Tax=Cichorium intybus TaxID=13427 RepID=A0ACB9BG89_CICIN|nr:hypothetical protein L2E82_32379 [Cichorium intybus]